MRPSPDDPVADKEQQQQKALARIRLILRGCGAFFILTAPVIGLNLGGSAAALGLAGLEKDVGFALFVVGVLDYYVMPYILGKKLRP